jgi:hypothetical protein
MRNASLHLEACWHSAKRDASSYQFQGEGAVRSIIAFTHQGAPRYRVGVQLQKLPKTVVQQLRQWQHERLMYTRNSHRQPVFVRYFINPRNFTKNKASGSADNPP